VKRLAIVAGFLILWSTPCWAQVAALVYDPKQDFNATFQIAQNVLSLANQALELTGLEAIVIQDGFDDDMSDIEAIAGDAQGLVGDIRALQSQITVLFDTNDLPGTPLAVTARYKEMQTAVRNARLYAVRAQMLATTVLRTVQHLRGLVSGISDLLGNQSANQTIIQIESTETKLLAAMQLQAASHQRADTLERMSDEVLRASLIEMRSHFLDGWPGLEEGGN